MSYFLWYFHSAHQGVCTLQLYDMQHFFFLSAHQSLKKQAPWLQAQRLPINIPSFHFPLCNLIKKRWGHDFWLLDSPCFRSNFSPHLSLMPREPLPPQPLCLPMDELTAQWELSGRKLLSTAIGLREITIKGMGSLCGPGICVAPLPSSLTAVCVGVACRHTCQAAGQSYPHSNNAAGLLGSCPVNIPWSIFKFPCLFPFWKEAKNETGWLSPPFRDKSNQQG